MKKENITNEYFKNQYTDKVIDFDRKMISDFNFYSCGEQNCEHGYTYGPIAREYHFIHFVVSGEGTLYVNNKAFPVKAGEAFISPARDIITYEASIDNPWLYCWIGFLGTQSDQYVQMLSRQGKLNYVLHDIDCDFYYKKIKEIIAYEGNELSKFLLGNGMLNEIMGKLLENVQEKKIDHLQTSIAFQARKYIDLHYHDGIQINTLASEIGVHPNYLSLAFKKEYKMNPKSYLHKLQISKAEELLIGTDYPINIVSNSVGYSDPLAFSKFFKKEKGVSPTEFREMSQSEKGTKK